MTVTRFAPSPTGLLHLGHAYSAWFSRNAGDEWLLRIEDLDRERSKSCWEEALLEDLTWLGLTPRLPAVRQSERMPFYQDALDRLNERGLIYPCFCSRSEILAETAAMPSAPHGPDGPHYPGTCRSLDPFQVQDWLAEGRPHSWRLNAAAAASRVSGDSWSDEEYGVFPLNPLLFGDPILARRDTGVSYHLAVVVDDAAQGVTLVTRGCDLLPSTHLHVLLQRLLDLPVPGHRHHGLVVDEEGRRLAKRSDAQSLRALREQGWTPSQAIAFAEQRLRTCTVSPLQPVPNH